MTQEEKIATLRRALEAVAASVPFSTYRGDGELEEVERLVLSALKDTQE